MWRVVLVLVCFWPAQWIAAAEHRRHSDCFVVSTLFFFLETERTWRDVLSGRNSAFITVLLLQTLRWGRGNEKKQLKNRPCPVAPASGTKRGAAIRDSRDGCKLSRQVRKKTSFLFISFFVFFSKRVHTCLYYLSLSLPVCFTLLDCSR